MAQPAKATSLTTTAFPHVRRWVLAGATLITVGYCTSIGVRLLTANTHLIYTEYVAAVASAVGLGLALRGRVRPAAVFVVAIVWLELNTSIFISGGIGRAGLPVFPGLVVVTGLFLGGGAAIGLAAVTVASVPAAAVAGAALFGGPGVDAIDLHQLVVLDLTILASAYLVHQGIVSFRAVAQTGAAHERKFTLLHRHAPYGMVLLDDTGRIESANPAAEAMLERSEADLRGRFFPEVLAPMTDHAVVTMPDVTVPGASELALKHAAGRRLVEVSGSRTTLSDGAGAVQVLLRDVTERRAAEQHAIELGRMLDQALGEAYVFDGDTLRLLFVNQGARRNLGYTEAELEALTITEVVPDLTRTGVRRLMTELSGQADQMIALAGRHRRKDGSTYPVEARLHLVTFDGESAVGLFALDVSARVAAAEEHDRLRVRMLQAQRFEVVRQLVGAIAHEFNNLLMAVGGYAEMIAQFTAEDRVRRWAERVRAGQQRGAGLIRRLQGLTRTEATPERVAVGEAVRDFLPLLERMIGTPVRLAADEAGGDVVVLDRSHLEQIVLHLAASVRDTVPGGGSMVLEVRGSDGGPGGEVCLEVGTAGIGLSAETRARAPAEPGAWRGGAAPDLTAVRSIVAQAGGEVDVEGPPAVVRVRFPAAATRRSGPQTAAGLPEPGEPLPGHILIVEDDADAREVVSLALTGAGHLVRAVESAEEALAWLDERRGDVDLVLTDVDLPGMSGVVLGGEVDARFAPTRVLYMSGNAPSEPSAAASLDPATNLLLKPFTTETLLRRVRAALQTAPPRRPPPAA